MESAYIETDSAGYVTAPAARTANRYAPNTASGLLDT